MKTLLTILCMVAISSVWAGELSAQSLFADPVYYSVGYDPHDVCAGQLDDDNWVDLAVVNRNSASVSVLLNNGDGTFQATNSFGVGSGPLALTVCRLDDDSHLDIITSNSTSDNISVLINNGDGTFDGAINYPVGNQPWGIVAADFNGDTAIDIAVVNRSSLSVSLLMNDGGGTLSLAGSIAAGGAYTKPAWIAAGDFDADEDVDLVVTKNYHNLYFNEGYIEIFINDGTGNFASDRTVTIGVSAKTPLAVDLDGDEDLDLAISGFVNNSYKLSVLLNDGAGNFADPVTHYAAADGRACTGDFDSDGDFDVAISRQGHGAGSFAVLLNNGDATFASAFTVAVGSDPMGLVAQDIDRDGDEDVVVTVSGENTVAVVMSTADPTVSVGEHDIAGLLTGGGLGQNYPNPFNSQTTISFTVDQAQSVAIAVYDITGKHVSLLTDEIYAVGTHTVDWKGRDDLGRAVPSGVYYYRLEAGNYHDTHQMLLIK